MKKDEGVCETCGCIAPLTRHHLVPQSRTKNGYKDLKDDLSNIIMICRPCHDAIHATYGETERRNLYSTKEKLMAAPEFAKFVAWRRKHPEFKGSSKMGNRRR